ncbi:MAG: hypothetical protein HYS74_00270 [Parcubacteria group bacterium]|nr:hypothetical protein [Parcubacteria group bacterium]
MPPTENIPPIPPTEDNADPIQNNPPVEQPRPESVPPQTQWDILKSFFTRARWQWLLAGLVVIGALAAGWYYFFGTTNLSLPFGLQPEKKEYLIGGVPYWGLYRGTELTTSSAFTAYTLLRYWGDDRFTPQEVARRFPVTNRPRVIL